MCPNSLSAWRLQFGAIHVSEDCAPFDPNLVEYI